MNRVKIIAIGMISGLLLSLVSTTAAGSLWVLLIEQPVGLAALIVFGLLNGAVVGGVSCLLTRVTHGLEHDLLVVLISIALAAITVLIGSYNNQSIVPLTLYALALVNGLLVAQVKPLLYSVKEQAAHKYGR